MQTINLNDHIKVKLSDAGKDIYYHQYDEINRKLRLLSGKPTTIKPTMPKVDTEGYTKFQLWEFMHLYGKYIMMGGESILETLNIIVCDEEKESDSE